MSISAVVLTLNEEKNIQECLSNLSFCDEVVVVDDNSIDKTVEIAKKMGAKIVTHPLEYDFAAQRNFALSQVKGDWVLFVDADERIDKRLQNDIESAIQQDIYKGFFLKRRDFLWGKPLLHGENGHIQLLRLAKKNSGKWIGKVHETWQVEGNIQMLPHYLLHYPHQSIVEFLNEINLYTTLRAKELVAQGVTANFWSVLFYTKAKFIQNYFFKFGFMDGIRGFIVVLIMSFHSFLVRGKVWELQKKK